MSTLRPHTVPRRTFLVTAALAPFVTCGNAAADPDGLIFVESYRDGQRTDNEVLTAAFEAAESGSEIRLGPGVTYTIAEPLECLLRDKENVVINGQGAVIAGPTITGTVLLIQGEKTATTTTLSSADMPTPKTIKVTSTSGFSAGDMVSITSDSEIFNPDRTYYFKQEMARISSIADDTTLVMDWPIWNTYSLTGHTVAITRFIPVKNLTVKCLQIIGANDGSTYQFGFMVRYFDGVKLDDIEVSGAPYHGVVVETGIDAVISNSRAFDCNADGYGYGFFVQETNTAKIIDCYGSRNRHSFDSDFSRDVLYSGCTAVGDKSAGISTHGNSDVATITNCTVKDCGGGIIARGRGTLIQGNHITGTRLPSDSNQTYRHGIFLGDDAPNHWGAGLAGTNLVIESNNIDFTGIDLSIGGFCGIYSTAPLKSARISDNFIAGFSSHGIYSKADTNSAVEIRGNKIDCSAQSSSSDTFAMGILLEPKRDNVAANVQTDIDVKRNFLTGASGSGIRIAGGYTNNPVTDNLRILSNQIGPCGAAPVYLGPGYFGSDIEIYGNEVEDGAAVADLAGIFSREPQMERRG